MCEHGAKLLAQWLRVGRRKRPEISSVLAWGQANFQNELDAIARIVSSAREFPFPSRFLLALPWIASVLRIYIYTTVNMQSTAEEKQQAAYIGKAIRRLCSPYAFPSCAAHARPAERDFHLVFIKAVFRLYVSWGMIIMQCGCDQSRLNAHSLDPNSMRIESWSNVDRP